MARTRLSTTVDAALLEGARRLRAGSTDAALVDEALEALLARHRAAEIDVSLPPMTVTHSTSRMRGGDLASFRRAAGAS